MFPEGRPAGLGVQPLPLLCRLSRGDLEAASTNGPLSPRIRPTRRRSCSSSSVIVTGGEKIGALATVRALRQAGYEPWVAVSRSGGYATRSRAAAGTITLPDPGTNARAFVAALVEAAVQVDAAAVLPGTEAALLVLAEHRNDFPTNVAVGVCAPDVVALATNKGALESFVRAAGLDALPSLILEPSDIEGTTLSYPLVVKPLRSEATTAEGTFVHHRVRRVDNVMELSLALDVLPGRKGLVQPYLGKELGGVGGVCWNGKIICAVHMMAERIWPLDCGTFSSAVTVPPDLEFERLLEQMLAHIGWNGLFQVDFLVAGGRRYVIDLNPRIYTCLGLAVGAGLNLPAIWVGLLLGKPFHTPPYTAGVRYRNDQDDLRAIFATLASGTRGIAFGSSARRRKTVHAVFSARDPLPALTTLAKAKDLIDEKRRSRRVAQPS
jgi:predicted ATP-grasp superfamily ATP-dependent carboligase